MLKLGLIGAGRWGRNYIKTIESLENIKLSAIATSKTDVTDLVKDDCFITHSWEELISDKYLDAVIVATPPYAHGEIIKEAVKLNLPVMVEKPLTLDYKEAIELNKLVKETDVPILVDHTYLFHPAYSALKKCINNVSDIKIISSTGGNWGPFREGVSVLWDWGPHDISMILNLLNEIPSMVSARVIEEDLSVEKQDRKLIELELNFHSGVKASTIIGNIMRQKSRSLIIRTGAKEIIFDDLIKNKLQIKCKGKTKVINVENNMPLTAAISYFCQGVTGGSRELFGLDFAVDVLGVLHKAEMALKKISYCKQ